MELNNRIIEIFRDSTKFKELVSLFTPKDYYFSWAKDCYSFVTQLHPEYMNPAQMARTSRLYSDWLDANPSIVEGLRGEERNRFFYQMIDQLQTFADGKTENYRYKALKVDMDAISLALFNKCGFFKPVLYRYRYDVFEDNCRFIGIRLPDPPVSKEYRNYFSFYFEICEAISKFQIEKQLTDTELCALIYGIESEREYNITDLPEPTHIWLIGASGEDLIRLADTANPKPAIWQGNERSCRGDLVLVYCLAPDSAIKYVYRVVAEGIFNPFDKYQARIAICNGIKVPEITFEVLKKRFGHLALVKKNLQGLNGTSFPFHDYMTLVQLWEDKGLDKSVLPNLTTTEDLNVEINSENDVYNLIVDKIIPRLGYKEGDWKGGQYDQLKHQYGRNQFGIPDYVFFPHGEHLHERAPFVIEAKEAFKNIRQFNKDFSQGYAYAQSLHATYLGLCDKDELIIIEGFNGVFSMDNLRFRRSWHDIFSKEKVLLELRALVGREVIKKLI